MLAVGPVSRLALQGERLFITGVCALRVLNMVLCQHRPDRAMEVRGAHHAEVGLELYLQVLVFASQLRDLNLGFFQLLRVHCDLLLQSLTLKCQELRKMSKERHKRVEERKEGKQRRGKKKQKGRQTEGWKTRQPHLSPMDSVTHLPLV